jgi:endoglucanase
VDTYIEQVFLLSRKTGISGYEQEVSQSIAELLRKYTDEIVIDPLYNVRAAIRCGKPGAKKVLLDAHIDEIGLMVTGIEKQGFIRFCNIGGVDRRILPGASVTVHGKEKLYGIVAVKPPHIQTEEEMKKSIPVEDMVIDLGYGYDSLKELISVGDMITLRAEPIKLLGDAISGKSLDDRAGLAAILYALDQVKDKLSNIDVEIMASAQEEVGTRGATTGGYLSDPDLALIVDVGHAKTPDGPEDRTYEFSGGVMIGSGPNLHPDITDDLIILARERDIPYQIEVMGGNTGTNAWPLQMVRKGISCGLLSIPMRYMHTTIESISMKDFFAVGDLMAEYLKKIDIDEGINKGAEY